MNSESAAPDLSHEARIEHTLRSIITRLDSELETANNWGCLAGSLLLAPAILGLFWWLDGSIWLGLVSAVIVTLGLWVLFWTWYDGGAAQREAAVFTQHFPPGHPDRELALRMLTEMPFPNRAHAKLHAALVKK